MVSGYKAFGIYRSGSRFGVISGKSHDGALLSFLISGNPQKGPGPVNSNYSKYSIPLILFRNFPEHLKVTTRRFLNIKS